MPHGRVMETNSTSFDSVSDPTPPSAASVAGPRRVRPVMTAQRRAQLMCQMRAEGKPLAEIGAAFGVTRERARQIIREAGGPGKAQVRVVREQRRQRERAALRRRVLTALPGQTAEEVAAGLGVTADEVRAALGDDARRFLIQINDWSPTCTDEDLLHDLQRAAALVGGPLTRKGYERVRQVFGGRSAALIVVRFGYWRAACERAGVACGETLRTRYTRRWTAEEMIDHVADYLAVPGSGTFSGYDAYSRSAPGAPSGATVRNAIGTWADIKTRALIRLAGRSEALVVTDSSGLPG